MERMQSDSDAIDIAIGRFQQERYTESNLLLLSLVREGINTSFISFCIGRNFLYASDFENAADWFETSLSIEPPFRWTYYELCSLREREQKLIDAASLAEKFVASYSSEHAAIALNQTHRDSLLRVGHKCFEVNREASVSLYCRLESTGISDYLSSLRIIESEIDKCNFSGAEGAIRILQAQHTLDPWGEFALSKILWGQGKELIAVGTIIKVLKNTSSAAVTVAAIHRLLDFRAVIEARNQYDNLIPQLLEQGPEFQDECNGIDFRISVLIRAHERILAVCRVQSNLLRIPNWIIVEALFAFALPGEQVSQIDIEVATVLATWLEKINPYTLGALLALYQFYGQRRMWGKIESLEKDIEAHPLFSHPEVLLRRFETLCTMSRMEEAQLFYHQHYMSASLGQWEACIVMRFLAEMKMWAEAASLLKQFVMKGYSFPDGNYFFLRICRRANVHRDIILLIQSINDLEVRERSLKLRGLLIDDLLVQNSCQSSGVSDEFFPWTISEENRGLVKAPRQLEELGVAFFACADKAYFLSLFTLLVSIAINTARFDRLSWYVFAARDVPPEWLKVLLDFGASVGFSLKVVAEADYVESGATHVEDYGMFTGGNTLSRAAFLRIYAAKYLYSLGKFDRACYLDTDIVCQKDIFDFVGQPFEDCLLLARAEEPTPEVQIVAARHGILETSYFNSGVLAFNFTNKDVVTCIDHALRIAEDDPKRLVFHDQCALNIAFSGTVRLIESKFNFFLRPHRLNNGDFSIAVFLHFLDRPKPWDITYSREYRHLWFHCADMVRMLLDPTHFNALVSAANY